MCRLGGWKWRLMTRARRSGGDGGHLVGEGGGSGSSPIVGAQFSSWAYHERERESEHVSERGHRPRRRRGYLILLFRYFPCFTKRNRKKRGDRHSHPTGSAARGQVYAVLGRSFEPHGDVAAVW